MIPWEEKSSEVIFEAGFMKLRKSVSVNPRNGHEGNYYVFSFPDWVTVVPFTKDDKIVMIRQYRHGSSAYELELPGGCLEEGEDIVHGGIRELQEETGGITAEFELVGKVRPNPSMQDNWCYTVIAKDVELIGERNLDLGEDIEVVTMTREEVRKAIFEGHLSNTMMISSLYFAGV